uniref:Myb-like domain-containing protein n=1 Tax=Sinocyclocheilus grahami TaxID=75366 RepID=A0A672MVV1_SINGR
MKTWLQEVALPRAELAQPICSFIGMTVANNPCAQEYFVSVGGLDSLSDSLTRVLSQSAHSAPACKMATVITKTLSACISNNGKTHAHTPQENYLILRVIPGLLCLLSSPNLDPQDQLAVVLMIGHLTDACEHQSQLLSAGGLPIMISLLTEASDEEVRKAAMFVLHTCKRITESLGTGMSTMDLKEESDMESHWRSAKEILQRIQLLEKKVFLFVNVYYDIMICIVYYFRIIKAILPLSVFFSVLSLFFLSCMFFVSMLSCAHTHLFHLSGCVKHMNEMDSRSYGAVLRSCRFQCDFHLVLREAEDRFRRSQQLKRTSHTLTHTHIHTHDKNRKSTSENTERSKRGKHMLSHQPSDRCRHRERRNFSADELQYLKFGVKRFGHSWNSILWTYPFQPGRTNVDLAKKYQHMQV